MKFHENQFNPSRILKGIQTDEQKNFNRLSAAMRTFLKAKFCAQPSRAACRNTERSYDSYSSGQWAKIKSVITPSINKYSQNTRVCR